MSNTSKIPYQSLLIYNAHSPSLIINRVNEKVKVVKITIPSGDKEKHLVTQPITLESIQKSRAFSYEIDQDIITIKSLEPKGEFLSKIVITNLKLNDVRNNASIAIQEDNNKFDLSLENYNAFVNSFYACSSNNSPQNLFEANDANNIQLHWNGHKDCSYELNINGKEINSAEVLGFRYEVNPDDLDFVNYCQLKATYNGQPKIEIINEWSFEFRKPDFSKIFLWNSHPDIESWENYSQKVKMLKIHDPDYKGIDELEMYYLCYLSLDIEELNHKETEFINKILLNNVPIYEKGKTKLKRIPLDSYNISLIQHNQFTVEYVLPNGKINPNEEIIGNFKMKIDQRQLDLIFKRSNSPLLENYYSNLYLGQEKDERLNVRINDMYIYEDGASIKFTNFETKFMEFIAINEIRIGQYTFVNSNESYSIKSKPFNHFYLEDTELSKSSKKTLRRQKIRDKIGNRLEYPYKSGCSYWINIREAKPYLFRGLNSLDIHLVIPSKDQFYIKFESVFFYEYRHALTVEKGCNKLYDKREVSAFNVKKVNNNSITDRKTFDYYSDAIFSDDEIYSMRLDKGILRVYKKENNKLQEIEILHTEVIEKAIVLTKDNSSYYYLEISTKGDLMLYDYKEEINDEKIEEGRFYKLTKGKKEIKLVESNSYQDSEGATLKITNEGIVVIESAKGNQIILKDLLKN